MMTPQPLTHSSSKRSLKSRTSCIKWLLCLIIPLLAACDWVDSAGDGNPDAFVDTPSPSTTIELIDGQAIAVKENSRIEAVPYSVDQHNLDWRWKLSDLADPLVCDAFDGFDSAKAENTLQAACTSNASCTINIEKPKLASGTAFHITVPELQSSVALDFELTATDLQGTLITRHQTFCAVAINEAPLPTIDEMLVLSSQTRVSNANDVDAILANDTDDTDNRNEPLKIDLDSIQLPFYASAFSLSEDGNFTYKVDKSRLPDTREPVLDRFVYRITDGVHSVEATTLLRIVDTNRSPMLIQPLGTMSIFVETGIDQFNSSDNPSNNSITDHVSEAHAPAGAPISTGSLYLSLKDYFTDPDEDRLYFSIIGNESHTGIDIKLLDNGLLVLSASAEQVGQSLITVQASDGISSIRSSLVLTVATQ